MLLQSGHGRTTYSYKELTKMHELYPSGWGTHRYYTTPSDLHGSIDYTCRKSNMLKYASAGRAIYYSMQLKKDIANTIHDPRRASKTRF